MDEPRQPRIDEGLLKQKARASAVFFAVVSAVLSKLFFGTDPLAPRSLVGSLASACVFSVFWYWYYLRQVRAALARRAQEQGE